MQSAHAVFQCKACHARRDVTVADDGASTALPEDPKAREKRVNKLLRHATCPACKARDPEAVAAHRRDARRGRLSMAAGYAVIAGASFFLPKLALLPAIYMMFLWTIALKIRIRRRYWFPILFELAMATAITVLVFGAPHRAFLAPAMISVFALWPWRSSSDPFADAAEQLRFSESPYR